MEVKYCYDDSRNRAVIRLSTEDDDIQIDMTVFTACRLISALSAAVAEAFIDFTATVPRLPKVRHRRKLSPDSADIGVIFEEASEMSPEMWEALDKKMGMANEPSEG